MPDFGLTEAIAGALKASKGVPVMRAAEIKLAQQAARTAPDAVAPAVPGAPPAVPPRAAVAPSAPAPGATQAPPINPSVPPAPVTAPPVEAQPAPADPGMAATSVAADPVPPPAPSAAPPAAPPPAPGAVPPINKVPPPAAPPPPISDAQAAAQRLTRANLPGELAQTANLDHMPNVEVLTAPDGVKAGILQVARENADAINTASRGEVPDAQLIQVAQTLSTTLDTARQILGRTVGENFATPEVAGAANILLTHQAATTIALSDKVANGTATLAEQAQWHQQTQLFQALMAQTQGGKAEAGRTLRALGLDMGGLPPEVLDHVVEVLNRNNPDTQATAAAIRLAGTPAGVANILGGMGNMSVLKRMGVATSGLIQRVFINGILSGPPTWMKIILGNNYSLLLNQFDLFSAGVGRGAAGLFAHSGGVPTAEEGVAMSDAFAHVHGVISSGADALRVAGRVLRTGQSMDGIMRAREGAGTSGRSSIQAAFPEIADTWYGGLSHLVLDTAVDMPGRLIGSIDDFTKTMGYRGYVTMMSLKEVRARLAKGDLKPEDAASVMENMMRDPSESMQQAAEDWAHRMTFQSPFPQGGPGQAFQNLINKVPALRFIFPFMRTATNIFKQSLVERTPLAVFSARIRAQIANGGFEGDLAKARIATGTAITGMLAWMAIHDRITGDAPKDPKERMEWGLDGRKPYSVRITDPMTGKDTWHDYSWFEPMATIAGATADAVKLHAYIAGYDDVESMMPSENRIWDIAGNITAAVIQNTGNKTFMQGASAFSEMYNDPQRGLKMWADQMGANFQPYSGMTKFVRNEQDPFMRQAFTMMDKVRDQLPTIPGVVKGSKTLMPRLDLFGEPRDRRAGNAILGPLNPFPGSPSKKDDLTDEIQSVMEQTRTVPLTMPSQQMAYLGAERGMQSGAGMRLTPQEYNDYVLKSRSDPIFDGGKRTFREELERVTATPTYQNSTPAQRADILHSVQYKADKIGADRLFKDNEDFRQRMIEWTAEARRIKLGK